MPMNRIMVFAAVATLFQAVGQFLFTGLGLLQYFCVIDFLRELPLLIFIRILYFHNPVPCGVRINIGQAIDGMANQAFVLMTQEPFTVTRTFIINTTNLGLSLLWLMSCVGLMSGGVKNKQTNSARYPWIMVTIVICGVDLVATVTYANDSFHTRTLSDTMEFIGGITSGAGNLEVDTSMASWVMVIIYSRFVVLLIMNVILIVIVVIDTNRIRIIRENAGTQVDAPTMTNEIESDKEDSIRSEYPAILPRPGLSQSFRRMKERLFRRRALPEPHVESGPNSLDASPERSPRVQHLEMDKKRTVNFPKNLMSLPQRLENLIAEQQRRLDKAVVDSSGRHSPPRASQSMPQLTTTGQDLSRGRRGTAAELQGQLPWAYIPASGHPMRDQLPPDEELPPVPLPDYTAIPSFRKASVHRAASSLSSLNQKRDFKAEAFRAKYKSPLTSSDVLY